MTIIIVIPWFKSLIPSGISLTRQNTCKRKQITPIKCIGIPLMYPIPPKY